MNRLLQLTLLASLAIASPAAAANSSLLSGYSGPGGGQQIILGPQGSGGGSGGGAAGSSNAGPIRAGGLAQAPSRVTTSIAPGIDRRTGQPVRVITRVVSGPVAAGPPAGYEQLAGRGNASSPLGGLSRGLVLLGAAVLGISALAMRRKPGTR